MKALILHGTYGSPTENWFPWLRAELEKRGYEVAVPELPTPENQSVDSWLGALRGQVKWGLDKDTVLVGHSCGATFILSGILSKAESPVGATFLVSPFIHDLGDERFDKLNYTFTHQQFDWNKIKQNAGKVTILYGDNDPYVPASEPREIADHLGVEPIIVSDGGHLNTEAGYNNFPKLLEEILQ
jgi:predicted alpha/beta hydrolase family esterase